MAQHHRRPLSSSATISSPAHNLSNLVTLPGLALLLVVFLASLQQQAPGGLVQAGWSDKVGDEW